MFARRTFLSTAAAGLFAPALARAAQEQPYQLPDRFQAQIVRVKPGYARGTIHILTGQHFLYYMLGDGKAIRYGVAVGAEGRNLSGNALVGRKVEWPSWRPTAAMIEREPSKYGPLRNGMPGGPRNPLGARAMYLYRNGRDTAYRIHGTPQPWSIGRSVSSGCIRMVNAHVVDLYARVPIGTVVTVY